MYASCVARLSLRVHVNQYWHRAGASTAHIWIKLIIQIPIARKTKLYEVEVQRCTRRSFETNKFFKYTFTKLCTQCHHHQYDTAEPSSCTVTVAVSTISLLFIIQFVQIVESDQVNFNCKIINKFLESYIYINKEFLKFYLFVNLTWS